MRAKLSQAVRAYFGTWWIPGASAIGVGLLLVALTTRYCGVLDRLKTAVAYAFFASVLGLAVTAVVSFARRRWLTGALDLLLIPLVLVFTVFAGFIAGAADDGFANGLTIPDNITVTEPLEWHKDLQRSDTMRAPREDAFQCRMMEALRAPGSADSAVTADIAPLLSLHRRHPSVLRRYLACSPCWRVFEEHGSMYATRRWMVGPHWHYELHGYYSNFDAGFQTRLTLGFSGKPWARIGRDSTLLEPGETRKLILNTSNSLNDSHLVIRQGDLVVEVMEQSSGPARRLTTAALAHLRGEFSELEKSPNWSTIQRFLAGTASPPARPTIKLWKSFQPGIYESEIWANPGEPGMVYLKAYEVTRNTRLSADELRRYASEWIGWSNNPKQLFLSNTVFTVSEGDWGKPYAARFEVWFVPDSRAPERKLMQRTFKIEGWQR